MGIEGAGKPDFHWDGFTDIKYEEFANRKMIEDMRSHPALFIKKVIVDAIEYYFPVFTKPFRAVKTVTTEEWASTLFHLLLWLAAVGGIFYCWPKGLLLLAGIFLYAVWYFPFGTAIPHNLYTFSTIPFLCILSATGVVGFFNGIPAKLCSRHIFKSWSG
jgi:hypothetical protein